MFTWIANAARSIWWDPSQNVEQMDRPSTPIPEPEGITAGLLLHPAADTPDGPGAPNDPSRVVVFVPDISQSSRDTWKSDGNHFWPNKSPNGLLVYTFDYDTDFAYSIEAILSYDSIRMIALRLLSALQKEKNKFGGFFSPVLIAHGYGGLICEQAYLFSRQALKWDGLIDFDGLVLFGTPHFLAGLAQWALISAKKLRIQCKDSPALEDWSKQPLDTNLNLIAAMQKEFRDFHSRDFNSELKMACFFSLLPVPESKLNISPEWAILPGVKATALNTHHFDMTSVNQTGSGEANDLLKLIDGKLPCRISQEQLKRRWIESTQTDHNQDLSHLSTMQPHVKRDKMFSPGSGGGPELVGPQSASYRGECIEIIRNIENKGMANDTRWLDSILDLDHIPTILDMAVRERGGLATLRALFVLHGDEITITADHLMSMADNRDALELILLLRGDQVFTTSTYKALAAAGGKDSDGLAIMQMLLNRYGDRNCLTDIEDMLKAAIANEENGAAVIEILLGRYVNRSPIDDKIDALKAAAASEPNGAVVIERLLRCFRDMVYTGYVIFDILKAAAANEKDGGAVMKAIIYGTGLVQFGLLQEIVADAARNSGSGAAVVQVLLDRFGDQIDFTNRLAKAASENDSLDMRLEVSKILLRAALKRDKRDTVFARLLCEPRHPHAKMVNTRFSWKMLSWAANQNDKETSELILNSGQVDHDLKDFDDGDWTPLFYAIFEKNEAVVKALVDSCHVNIDNVEVKRNKTPALAAAAGNGLTEAVKKLLTINGIQVDAKDGSDKDRTPLMHAAREGYVEIVKELLKNGADVNAEDREKETPVSQAKKGLFEAERVISLNPPQEFKEFWEANKKKYLDVMELLDTAGGGFDDL